MGLGSTTKKIQTIAEKAEQVYAQVDELRKQLASLQEKVDVTHDTVSDLKVKHEQNRALLEALAAEQGVDVEEVLTEAAIDDVDDPTATGTEAGPGAEETAAAESPKATEDAGTGSETS